MLKVSGNVWPFIFCSCVRHSVCKPLFSGDESHRRVIKQGWAILGGGGELQNLFLPLEYIPFFWGAIFQFLTVGNLLGCLQSQTEEGSQGSAFRLLMNLSTFSSVALQCPWNLFLQRVNLSNSCWADGGGWLAAQVGKANLSVQLFLNQTFNWFFCFQLEFRGSWWFQCLGLFWSCIKIGSFLVGCVPSAISRQSCFCFFHSVNPVTIHPTSVYPSVIKMWSVVHSAHALYVLSCLRLFIPLLSFFGGVFGGRWHFWRKIFSSFFSKDWINYKGPIWGESLSFLVNNKNRLFIVWG